METTWAAPASDLPSDRSDRPFGDEHLLTNFGSFFRSSALAKLFFLHEAYSKIRDMPGDVYVFGVWLGRDLVVFESMRAMLEPYDASREIVGFHMFEGSTRDVVSDVVEPEGSRRSSARFGRRCSFAVRRVAACS